MKKIIKFFMVLMLAVSATIGKAQVLVGIKGLPIYYENIATKIRAVEMMLFNEECFYRVLITHQHQGIYFVSLVNISSMIF